MLTYLLITIQGILILHKHSSCLFHFYSRMTGSEEKDKSQSTCEVIKFTCSCVTWSLTSPSLQSWSRYEKALHSSLQRHSVSSYFIPQTWKKFRTSFTHTDKNFSLGTYGNKLCKTVQMYILSLTMSKSHTHQKSHFN